MSVLSLGREIATTGPSWELTAVNNDLVSALSPGLLTEIVPSLQPIDLPQGKKTHSGLNELTECNLPGSLISSIEL